MNARRIVQQTTHVTSISSISLPAKDEAEGELSSCSSKLEEKKNQKTKMSNSRFETFSLNMNVFKTTALVLLVFASAFTSSSTLKIDEETCEVCVKFLKSFVLILTDEIKGTPTRIEDKFKEFCLDSKGKDNRFCYYIGGMADSATYILGEMSRPLSWSMPVEKVCEKLHKKDSQICELKYDKQIDLETVDLKKLKVKDLKKVLDTWGESCEGCLEKTDYIKMIETLKPKYVRQEL